MGATDVPSAASVALNDLPRGLNEGVAMVGDGPDIVQHIGLLVAKLIATSICIGSGLVGGTFAPSLFLGAVLGVAYQNAAGAVLGGIADAIAAYQTSIGVPVGSWGVIPRLTVADGPSYALIGAGATLASVFRAPLTAALLIVEITRKYDIILPLLAAACTGPLVVEQIKDRPVKGRALQTDRRSTATTASPSDCGTDSKLTCDSDDRKRLG
eukprot:gnl/MRDRNA2_/MRDRNA2_249542_c0_seq1.p1 gnl/MRDRNA2_/MRDRNA2_249542_c0~~gnl/MRDRNA2_/MRDRNA2_249542_c0_seq1.p1  ORF type:complete len:212 (+),score=31.34 gnl/MRDRNA2_/MRDRNA2_249542_c0_seq1:1-636(+)